MPCTIALRCTAAEKQRKRVGVRSRISRSTVPHPSPEGDPARGHQPRARDADVDAPLVSHEANSFLLLALVRPHAAEHHHVLLTTLGWEEEGEGQVGVVQAAGQEKGG
jgi:hypothetical protein